ncbi:MAG TPA: mechanosensitive ion channel family protein [Pseudonocardia sp.]
MTTPPTTPTPTPGATPTPTPSGGPSTSVAPADTLVPPAPSVGELVTRVADPICTGDPGPWCEQVYKWTDNDVLARSADLVVSRGAHIVLILVLGLIARYLLHRAILRLVEGATSSRISRMISRRTRPQLGENASAPVTPRRAQRARTIGSVLRSAGSFVIGLVVIGTILAEFGVALGPILASAGILGVALGFGAQNLVRDFLSGMFMLLEDQYGVGDIVDLGTANGTVEAVGLRITTVRDLNGTVWYVRNGEILRVGNKTQGHSVAVADVPLALGADMGRATDVAGRVAARLVAEPDLAEHVLGDPEVVGVEKITAEGATFRVTVRTAPGQQFRVQRALATALVRAFDEEGLPRPGVAPAPAAAREPAPPTPA